ncbi:alpha,alpha-trehalose-phosphate synthase (UDP-forming) [Noviherbaspirillum galbum]|uniref:Trehalose-6-phosphate synthase n=1 Tax=Noviherbaspirillum galbum TaxID=2709383 RepID=A0A6B3SW28_9BURK|nr:trehalose-6-phosphate synthase [Noviherbaspirillum galbum]NEX64711.1 trehalose-6-phosphate synthase [Noviherbaspirillum galbum]
MPTRLLRLSLRFALPLMLILALSAWLAVPLMDRVTLRWFVRDLDIRSQLLANTLEPPLQEYVPQRMKKKIGQLFDRAVQDERLYALAFCDQAGNTFVKTRTYPDGLGCDAARTDTGEPQSLVRLPRGAVHVAHKPVTLDGQTLGKLVLVHDMSFIERRSADATKYIVAVFALLGVAISLLSVFMAHASWRGWTNTMRGFLRRDFASGDAGAAPPEFLPLMGDLRSMIRDLQAERTTASGNAQGWNPERLRQLLHSELAGDEVIVVSNREPYIHEKNGNRIEVKRPASGLVTAVEAVMRACSGTWVAHGSGSADRMVVDRCDRVAVPPANPSYTLRRVWLSSEEEQGYYYGFANEGLWPLCHIAHVRPVFRSEDWNQYVAVNQRFADAVVKEARTDDPVVLVQDYHFALLPRMVRQALPRATIITFWHIPWPNPESFGICPWREQILEGMLGSTILGFHTPFHRRNFIETVDRYLETRIEAEASTISYDGKLTLVEAYPISIAWPESTTASTAEESRAIVCSDLGLPEDHLIGIGVDRLDYTKGIVERFQAVERMLERHPDMVGRFSFVQIAAPSRSSLEEYQQFAARVRKLAARINARCANGAYQPIVLKAEHHDHDRLLHYYRASQVCMVTSLHDGMNLVAKEYIAAREDEQGVLVLSQFTGAARELHEALIVNPYHIEQGADALHRALTMPRDEQRERMRSLRALVREFNVYRWAGRMLLDAARLRQRERIATRIHAHSRAPLRRVS